MRKRVLFGFFATLIVLGFLGVVWAQYETDVSDAFSCLDEKVSDKSSLSLEEALFSSLARISDSKVMDTIEDGKDSDEYCWPGSGCGLKETALAAIVYHDKQDYTTRDGALDWLESRTGVAQGMKWFIQISIDTNEPAECTIFQEGGEERTISIDEDMKIQGTPPSCLTPTRSGYWLQIGDNCLDKLFRIRCDKAFLTNLIYQKSDGETYYISSNVHGSSGDSFTEEKVSAQCFTSGGSCDYEGSLWATSAMKMAGRDVSGFVPYLIAFKEDNVNLMPPAFLVYILAQGVGGEYYDELLAMQNGGGYWDIKGGQEEYDTAVAMFGVAGRNSAGLSATLTWLFEYAQGDEGCWNNGNVRDTAFILYAGGWLNGGSGVECVSDDDCSSGEVCIDNECVDDSGDGPVDGEDYICGNGIIEDPEVCECGDDGVCGNLDDNLTEQVCSDVGSYGGGVLSCSAGCLNYNTTQCTPTGGGGGNLLVDCALEGFYCMSEADCWGAGGDIKPVERYSCEVSTQVCCSSPALEKTCSDLNGEVCGADEQCSGSEQITNGEVCCLGVCEVSSGTTCSGICRPSCADDENQVGGTCANNLNVCCVDSGSGGDEGGSFWVWIIILLILIALVVLGIIYRDKLRLWWFKLRGKSKSSKIPPGPRGPPPTGRPRPTPRFVPRGMPMMRRVPPARTSPRSSRGDEELDETMKKLREMSK